MSRSKTVTLRTGVELQSDAEKAAEMAMIGFGLQRPDRIDEIELEPEHFFDPRWAKAWAYLQAMRAEGQPITAVTLADRISTSFAPDAVPLAALLQAELEAAIFPEDYAAIVRESWVSRQVLFACSESIAARQDGIEGEDLLSLALQKLAAIQVSQGARTATIGNLVRARFKRLMQLSDAKAKGEVAVTGIPTGIEGLDLMLGGIQREICTVVAARPSMGKSAFGMTLAAHASSIGVGVHQFNMEDGEDSHADRALSRESMVAAQNIRTLELTSGDLGNLMYAAETLGQRQRWIVDNRGGLSAEEIVRSVRRELKQNATQLVIVDYVQLCQGNPRHTETQVIDHAMAQFQMAAKQDRIAYVVLSQLNRKCEERENKRPLLSDLKLSGAIEEKAKCVVMLYRPHYYREKDPETKQPYPESRIELLVRKQNNGQTGTVIARWNGPTTRID